MIESNIDEVIARLKARANHLRDVSVPLGQAGQAVRDLAVARFTGTNDWAPNSPYTIAQKGSSRPGIDTGALRNSITSSVEGNTATIGTNVRYARWFQDGTGIFGGGTPWTIRPKNGKALMFRGPSGDVYARTVTIQGQPARPFLVIDDAARDRVTQIFRAWALSLGDADAGAG